MAEKKIKLGEIDLELTATRLANFIEGSCRINGKSGGVLGLSGGVDSTLVAALAKRSGTDLWCYSLPSSANDPEDVDDALLVAKILEVPCEVLPINGILTAFEPLCFTAMEYNFHKGNLASRIRANILHTKAAEKNALVLGTGNADEDFGIGYYTLFGDGAVHISPIGALHKRHVKQMAEFLGFPEAAKREPTAGLEPGQTDLGDLGYTYELVELVMEGLRQGFSAEEMSHDEGIYKEANRIGHLTGRRGRSVAYIEDILRRHKMALRKASLVCPKVCPMEYIYD